MKNLRPEDIRGRSQSWVEITRAEALRLFRDIPVAVLHRMNGIERVGRFDQSSRFFLATRAVDFGGLKYFLRLGGGAGRSLKGLKAFDKPEEQEMETFEFPVIQESDFEAPAVKPAALKPPGLTPPGLKPPGLTPPTVPKAPGLTPPTVPKTPGLPGIPDVEGLAAQTLSAQAGFDVSLSLDIANGIVEGNTPAIPTLPAIPTVPKAPTLPNIPEVPPQALSLEDLAKEEKTFYAILAVDEAGEPVDDIELEIRTGEGPRVVKLSSGKAKLNDVPAGSATVAFKDIAAARQRLKDRGVLPDPAKQPTGSTVAALVARSGEEPAAIRTGEERSLILILPPRQVVVIELVDGLFRLDSAVVLPEAETPSKDAHGALSSRSVLATVLEFAEANPTRKLLIAGHTDTSGTESHNQTLSEDRASCALACLEGGDANRTAFGDVCDARHKISDYKQILSWAALQFGFSCDPGKIDEVEFSGIEPIRAFQKDYNAARADLGVPDADELKPDGSMGPKTWRAVFDCYEAALALEVSDAETAKERLSDLTTLRGGLKFMSDGTKGQGFGEEHPIEKVGVDNVRSQQNRRVELLFFHEGEEPDLSKKPKDSEIYAGGVFSRILVGEFTAGGISFLVTDSRRLPVAGAALQAQSGAITLVATSDALGQGRFADVPRGVYSVKATKDALWMDRATVKVAPGSEGRALPGRAQGNAV